MSQCADEDSSQDSADEDEDYYDEEDDEYGYEKQSKRKSKKKEKISKKVIINVYCTEYEVVKKTAQKVCGFKCIETAEDHEGSIRKGQGGGKLSLKWDITWHDLAITPDFFSKMEPC